MFENFSKNKNLTNKIHATAKANPKYKQFYAIRLAITNVTIIKNHNHFQLLQYSSDLLQSSNPQDLSSSLSLNQRRKEKNRFLIVYLLMLLLDSKIHNKTQQKTKQLFINYENILNLQIFQKKKFFK
ncbi:hypothetical protein pb186bvf_019295 [Paramecium bursaria]